MAFHMPYILFAILPSLLPAFQPMVQHIPNNSPRDPPTTKHLRDLRAPRLGRATSSTLTGDAEHRSDERACDAAGAGRRRRRTRPGTPLGKSSLLLSSRTLGVMDMNARAATPVGKPHALHPTQPIATPQALFDWLVLVHRAATHSQEAAGEPGYAWRFLEHGRARGRVYRILEGAQAVQVQDLP